MILVLNIECSPSFILGQGNLQFVALVVTAKSKFYSIKISPFSLFFFFRSSGGGSITLHVT